MSTANETLIRDLVEIASRYPVSPTGKHHMTLSDRENWARRTAFDIRVTTEHIGTEGRTVCDVGGGLGLFSLGCALLGMRSILIEDFYETEGLGILDPTLALLEAGGVEVVRRNMLTDDFGLAPQSLDAVTSFHVLEHLPVSPKPAFTQMARALNPGGVFVLAGPNAVNLRKRVAVPLGKQGWSPVHDWYNAERYRGHVREPRAEDFHYIARELGLINVRVRGANFMATAAGQRPWLKNLAPPLDALLRLRPSLCSELYMVAQRPA